MPSEDILGIEIASWRIHLPGHHGPGFLEEEEVMGVALGKVDDKGSAALAPGAADVVNVAAYDDIQELLVAADAMATDYSSCICDFLLGGRPGFIFAPDLDAYANGRGLCYPLETTPFPVAKTSSGLADAIRAFDAVRYAEARESFLEARGCVEDGQASARVADLIVAQTLGSR